MSNVSNRVSRRNPSLRNYLDGSGRSVATNQLQNIRVSIAVSFCMVQVVPWERQLSNGRPFCVEWSGIVRGPLLSKFCYFFHVIEIKLPPNFLKAGQPLL